MRLAPDTERLRRQIHALGRRGVRDDFGVRALRAIAREIERPEDPPSL